MKRALILALSLAALLAPSASADGLNQGQRRRTDALISNFENSTSVIQYCYVEALNDGRGYTVGRAGFTSATGDLLEVAEAYNKTAGNNPLTRFLPRLRQLAANEDGSLAGLEGLPDAWRATCNDARQRGQQDEIVNREYYRPARRRWRNLGLHTALSLAAVYDAFIQHGGGDDPDGVPAMLRRAKRRAHGTPRTGVRESRFLRSFLRVRRRTLLHAHDPDTRAAWRESVGRVTAFSYLVHTRQWRLRSPVKVNTRLYPHLTLR